MLNIDLEYKRGILFLRLNGKLNKKTSCILGDAIKELVNRVGIKYLLINFEKLYEIDKEGISTIISSYNSYLKKSGKLMVCGYDEKIKLKIENSDLLEYAVQTNNEISAVDLINI